uniref:Uncharacterized protein n=1 Tax=Cacopsylla melanoneura TaxID=428564 RepID=A0A8D8M2X9_9HEMI
MILMMVGLPRQMKKLKKKEKYIKKRIEWKLILILITTPSTTLIIGKWKRKEIGDIVVKSLQKTGGEIEAGVRRETEDIGLNHPDTKREIMTEIDTRIMIERSIERLLDLIGEIKVTETEDMIGGKLDRDRRYDRR